MNWRALTDPIVWLLFRHEPDTFAAMRRMFRRSA